MSEEAGQPGGVGVAAEDAAAGLAAAAPTAGPESRSRWLEAAKRWLSQGNVPVKVGMVVLFAGVAAFLKYASDEGWLRAPIEVRFGSVALAAVARWSSGSASEGEGRPSLWRCRAAPSESST